MAKNLGRPIVPHTKEDLKIALKVYQDYADQVHGSEVNSPFTRWIGRALANMKSERKKYDQD